MAETDSAQEPSELGRRQTQGPSQKKGPLSLTQLKCLIDDEIYGGLCRHFLMTGKGRRPDLPQVPTITHRLLIQLYFIKEEASTTFRELKTWLEKLAPDLSCVTESRISHRVNASLKTCLKMTKDQAQLFLQEEFDFHALSPPLAALQLNRRHLKDVEVYSQPPSVDVKNNVVIALEHFRSCENEPPIFVRKWLKILSLACVDLNDSILK